jgi:hypothetical protein
MSDAPIADRQQVRQLRLSLDSHPSLRGSGKGSIQFRPAGRVMGDRTLLHYLPTSCYVPSVVYLVCFIAVLLLTLHNVHFFYFSPRYRCDRWKTTLARVPHSNLAKRHFACTIPASNRLATRRRTNLVPRLSRPSVKHGS